MTHLIVEYVDPASLTPAPYNPRTMSDDARARLKRGIVEFGLVDPLIVRRADRLIVGGHQRHAVAVELGLAQIPVVFLDDLDDQRAAALNVLLNNQHAQGQWQYQRLTEVLSVLDAEGFDATLTAFDEGELRHLLAAEWSKPVAEGSLDDFKSAAGAHALTFTDEQWEAVATAVAVVMRADAKLTEADAVALICREYRAAHP